MLTCSQVSSIKGAYIDLLWRPHLSTDIHEPALGGGKCLPGNYPPGGVLDLKLSCP